MTPIKIIEYSDRYQSEFRDLNAEWLELYNLMEPHDLAILNDPHQHILKNGGVIYLAMAGQQVVGSAALIREHNGIFELAKMAVAKEFRQKGISKLLLEKCIDKAKELKASRVVLFSNHQLKAALGLYEKFGFKYIPVEHSPFATADIKMALELG
jgi:putative acetyltransferase